MAVVNNVTRLLDSKKIQYTAFELPAQKLGALETARLLNVDPEIVYKTIVVLREKPAKALLAVIPAGNEVDLKSPGSCAGRKESAPAHPA
jgi:Cys-tRNA(Pro)/Cys-tRNA(Cys) deacylase